MNKLQKLFALIKTSDSAGEVRHGCAAASRRIYHRVRARMYQKSTSYSFRRSLVANNALNCNDKATENDKVLYLTFDVEWIAPDNVNKILDVLKQKNIPAAFFFIGSGIKRNSDIVHRIVSEGHITCNHTFNHPDLTTCTHRVLKRELKMCAKEFYEVCGKKLSMVIRPPYGYIDILTAIRLNRLGYTTLLWNMHFKDYDQSDPATWNTISAHIDSTINSGNIILQHSHSPQTTQFIGEYIDRCLEKGYRFGTLDEFIGL